MGRTIYNNRKLFKDQIFKKKFKNQKLKTSV